MKYLIGILAFSLSISAQAACFKSNDYGGHGNFNACIQADKQQRRMENSQVELRHLLKEQEKRIEELQEELQAMEELSELDPLEPEKVDVVDPTSGN